MGIGAELSVRRTEEWFHILLEIFDLNEQN